MSNGPAPLPADRPLPISDSPGALSDRALWVWLVSGSLVSLFVFYSIASRSLLLGSREGGWTYEYVENFRARTMIISLIASAFSAALVFRLRPGVTRSDWPIVLAWIALALGLQGLIRALTPFTFERIFIDDGANSFYSVTRDFTAGSVLGDFDRLRASWPQHAQSNMPGKLMLVYALRNLSQQPAVLAWLTVVISNFGAVLMYLFVRELFMERRIAIYAAALYLLMPAKLYFFPLLNTVTPVIALGCALLVIKWLRTGHVGYAAALGVALFGVVFYEPLLLVLGLLFALFVGRALWLGQISWPRLLTQGGVVLAAWLAAYAMVRVSFGFDLVNAFRQIAEDAIRFNDEAGRPRWIWIRENLREFFFGVGVCTATVFWAALADGFRPGEPWRERLTRPITVLCLGLAAVLLALDVIGVNRGEVIRLWIFLACLFQIPAAYVCARLDTPVAPMLLIAVTVMQAGLGTAMIGFLIVR